MKNIYLCGPTVYSAPHIGNMRPILSFDMYIRSLIFLGEKVNFIHNITDIDDKIIDKALEENLTEKEISKKYEDQYKKLLIDYNILKPTCMPRVTDNIDEIIKFIEKIIINGDAYNLDGNIYFNVSKYSEYGKISNQDLSKMIFEKNLNKKHQADFALWKKTNVGFTFDSPWSKGRPGWHTECALFIEKYNNGNSLDIHGGGIDLIFPHHENEAIQYLSTNKKKLTKEWKHIGQLELEGQKMSKSLGNVWSALNFLENFNADTLRILFLFSNLTGPIKLNEGLISQTIKQREKFELVFKKAQLEAKETQFDISNIANEMANWKWASALELINKKIKEFNKNKNNGNEIIEIMKLIGFNFSKNTISIKEKKLYDDWELLRANKEFDKADIIRQTLVKKGIL